MKDLYEMLMSESQVGTQSRRLVNRYPRVANALLWCSATQKEISNSEVKVWNSPHGLGIEFTGDDQIFSLAEVEDWVKVMQILEECLPPMHSMPPQ